jgi:hypothetical protein
MKHSWSKTPFETWITRNDVKDASLFHIFYLITLMAYLFSQWTPNIQIRYFMFDWSIYIQFLLNTGWKRDSLQIMIVVNVSSTWCIVPLKTCFVLWITRNDVISLILFHLSYLLTIMVYLWSLLSPNAQIKYFMFDWSICSLFVVNTGWKHDSLQIKIFVNVCSTWCMF